MAGRNRYRVPLDATLQRKFDAIESVFELRVIGSTFAGMPRRWRNFELVPPFRLRPLDGALFYLTMPARVARILREFRPDAVLTQSPYEAAPVLVARRLAGSDARVVVDVHGDWRTHTRLYGSPLRALLRPFSDRLAAAALRRADAVRTVTPYTTRIVRELGVEPAASFPAFMDLEPFLGPPVRSPAAPTALFVGVLELYKDVDGLAEAWRLAAPRLPEEARLRIVGDGSRRHVVEALVRELPGRTSWEERLSTEEVARALDAATVLVLPSRSEGMGRVVVEALCRGRPVLATSAGGIPDLVRDGENGLLVPPQDPRALADALVRVLGEPPLAERLAAGARASAEPWLATPEDFAARLRDLVAQVAS